MSKQLTSYIPLTLGALTFIAIVITVAHLQGAPNSGQLILPTSSVGGSTFS